MTTTYEAVIGLEVHIQLNTKSKAFSNDRVQFSTNSNTNISSITLGLPGTLPRANRTHFYKAIKLGLSLGCTINRETYFDRKHYMYPDLPKGYQTTQDNLPICVGGMFKYNSEGVEKSIRIHHIHIEEDAGKSIHDMDDTNSLVDLNRAGTPLIELVTEPDFRSAQEVYDFYSAIQQWVQYLEISDGNMEEGSLRCDCNVSIRKHGHPYGERCEVKNVNSKRFARDAISFEIVRQKGILSRGETVVKSTLTFNPATGKTSPIRSKESVKDYRYMPDPDQPVYSFSEAEISSIQESIDWLPTTIRNLITNEHDIRTDQLEQIVEQKTTAKYFIRLASQTNGKDLANLFCQKLIPFAQKESKSIVDLLREEHIIEFINMFGTGKISKSKALSELLPRMLDSYNFNSVEELAAQLGMIQSDDQDFLDGYIDEIILEFPDKVQAFKKGKVGLLGFFMGQVKRRVSNDVNPQVLKEKLLARLSE